jgi:cyclic nucleotide gated channel alpha 3
LRAVFAIASYMIGIFVYSSIIGKFQRQFFVMSISIVLGQVGNVITNRNASRLEFERLLVGNK